ncbi:hypothetical protein Poli38472_005740 [Pythium oligandrum]|uniref:Zinc transporter n=1 Tax=Pythium oligandrum TaxID=41045 RepID=A0A8K1CR44_PYTOL|nr:hypothetical protein Poli38472_005740 [Pythium oligandrum]|eukprot:TMW68272.1 hypothetical protein Poli38472_005740 [Pythium oligandrum]
METGMTVAAAFLVTTGASAAFVVGGIMVYSSILLSMACPLVFVVLFSTSSFIFVCSALMVLIPHAQASFTELVHQKHAVYPHQASGWGQLLGIIGLVAGILLLYGVDAVIYRLSIAAANCYSNRSQLPQRVVSRRGSLSQLGFLATGPSPDARLMTSGRSGNIGFNRLQGSGRATPGIPEIPEDDRSTIQHNHRRHYGGLLSALAVLLHHIPGGLAIYVSAVQHLNLGVAIAIAVVLHSVPDGIALASSIYFASGKRFLGVFWCLLAPLGKLIGAFLGWLLLGRTAWAHAILSSFAAGILVGIGVKEVLPTTHQYIGGKSHGTVIGVASGMIILALCDFVRY